MLHPISTERDPGKAENDTQGKRGEVTQNKLNESSPRNLWMKIFEKFISIKVLQMTNSTTEEKKDLKGKIFEFQKLWIVIWRNATAEIQTKSWSKFSYKYSSFDEIREKISPKLNELQLLVTHSVQDYWGVLYLETAVTDMESGESTTSMIPITTDQTPQTLWSAITYFKRYNTCAILNIIIAWEDDDWAAAEKKSTTPKKSATPQKPQFLDPNFEKFKEWTKGKSLEEITHQKDQILAKYVVSEEMCKKLDDFLLSL